MTNTIEKVARALAEVDANHEVYHQRPYMEWARAALAAVLEDMTEPSEAMDVAGDNSFQWGGPTGAEWLEAADSTECWQAMLSEYAKEALE